MTIASWHGEINLQNKHNLISYVAKVKGQRIEGFTVADVILVVGQNLQWMYGKNHDFDAR